MTAGNALADVQPMIDCERAAAARYDDGRSKIATVAQQVLDVCSVEILASERAFHLSPNDPDVKLDEFKQAVGIVDEVRKSRVGGK